MNVDNDLMWFQNGGKQYNTILDWNNAYDVIELVRVWILRLRFWPFSNEKWKDHSFMMVESS